MARVYFNGETLTIPGAYTSVDVSGMIKKDTDEAKIIALIGESDGGEPGTVHFFDDPLSAKRVLKGGELLKACEKAWTPVTKTKTGVKLGGANVIACIRANKATQAQYELKKSEKTQVKFKSKDWGAKTNCRVKITKGTLNSTKKVLIHDTANNLYETFDNLGNVFTIAYTGDQPYAEINTYLDGSKVFCVQTKIGTSATDCHEDILIKCTDDSVRSIRQLAQQLQSYENYTVSTLNVFNSRLKASDLDLITKGKIKLTGSQEPFRVTAVFADLQLRLATNSTLIGVEEYDKTLGELEDVEWLQLTGGTDGRTPASWVEYFDMLSNYDITYIVPLTPEISIHAELASHVKAMSKSLGKERRGIVGGALGETINETIVRAKDVASDRMQVVHGGMWDYDEKNQIKLYPPYILASQHAGRCAFLEDGESATYDVYRMVSPEYKLERFQISDLLASGVLAFEFVLGRNSTSASFVRLVHDLTTDTASLDTLHTERATGALADSINKEMRDELDAMLTGKRTSLGDLTSAKNKVISILENRVRKEHIIAFKNVTVVKRGTVTYIDYMIAPAEPNNFTLITSHYYSETLTLD